MFSKNVSELIYADIEDLVNIRKEREGYHLDFKGEIGHPDKAKKEIAKDISAFTNSYGGYLIFGVNNNYTITGIDPSIQNKSVDEWLNQVLDSNIEPQLFYYDPKVIEIPDSEKLIVVIHVPESTKKPHIVTEVNKYHIRINDSAKAANHGQIRDMFEFSRTRTDEFNNFLSKRNLLNEDVSSFGINKNSAALHIDIPQSLKYPDPFILFSLVPKYPNEEKIKMPFGEFRTWLNANSAGYAPYESMNLFYANIDTDPKLDGVVIKRMKDFGMTSYFEILNNGFVEAGLSTSVIDTYKNKYKNNQEEVVIYLTHLVMYEMLLLGFAKKFYEFIRYSDEILLQISFVNVQNLRLFGFNQKYDNSLLRYQASNTSNSQHKNFKLNITLNPKNLTETEILSIAKIHSEKICRSFGLPQEFAFIDDKLSLSQMHTFYL